MDKEAVLRHCIADCDGALTDDQRRELKSRIGGAIEAEREACAKTALAEDSFMMLQDFGMQSMCTQVRENVAAAIRAPRRKGVPTRPMITETITFNFETEEQQRRFHERLQGQEDAVLAEREACAKSAEAFAAGVSKGSCSWGTAMLIAEGIRNRSKAV